MNSNKGKVGRPRGIGKEQVKVYVPVGTDRDKLREAVGLYLDGIAGEFGRMAYGCGPDHLPDIGMPRVMDIPFEGTVPEVIAGSGVEDPRDQEIARLKKRIDELELELEHRCFG